MIGFDAIIFDFDGVLIESEFEGNRHLAELLSSLGHPTTVADAVEHYTGLSGRDFVSAVEQRIGRELPPSSTRRPGRFVTGRSKRESPPLLERSSSSARFRRPY